MTDKDKEAIAKEMAQELAVLDVSDSPTPAELAARIAVYCYDKQRLRELIYILKEIDGSFEWFKSRSRHYHKKLLKYK